MDFEITESIKAPFDQILEAWQDPEYYLHLAARAQGSVDRPELLAVSRLEESLSFSVRYHFAGEISGAIAMAVDVEKLTWVIETTMDLAGRRATIDVIPDHYGDLMSCDAVATFEESQGFTSESFVGTLLVHVPFFGTTVEEAIVKGLKAHLAMEASALTAFCST